LQQQKFITKQKPEEMQAPLEVARTRSVSTSNGARFL